ncbi:TIGR04255 family protein [Stenomitos frigidus]|uniref:TIGR04255 family protein n=1 Tax=Stenomitos frigidus ULC18 TaxID=2107698 RepID=A0A2T1ESP4_9CYAN|nr:TIGR04255 family protein [Stenomitos frigidus]PSB35780.1 hypothetical protein C7B82_00195 [Stenomitos frigidus ULC18]
MGEQLKSQPLVEALCEFQFNLDDSNELTMPGLFYAEVREEFPFQTPVDEFSLQVELGEVGGVPQFVSPQRLQLKRTDGSAMLQIGRGRLIVNRLQPYVSWEDFRELIFKAFTIYIKLCGTYTLKRIGLRYINHLIPPAEGGFKIDDFLTVIPLFPKPIDRPMNGFQQVYEFSYELPKAALVHRTAVVAIPEGDTAILLDLDFISQETSTFQDNAKALEWLRNWLDQAHERIEEAFISSLNPSYYEFLK